MPRNPVEAVIALAGQAVIALVVFAAVAVIVFGYEPEPCPRHICFPRDEVVTVEQMIRDDPARFAPNAAR